MSILYRSAFGLAGDIKTGKLSAVQVLEFFLQRIERFDPALNAVVVLDTERALARAREADSAAAAGEDWGALHGVPLTIKDAWCAQGITTAAGIPALRDFVPEHNALAIQTLVDAGAIVFAKTNVPFMCSDLQTFNDVYGTTNNPWNTERTSGGSSGGAAVAIACGFSPLELGSDMGGSIRTPCHFNGIYGHKSSYGLLSERGLVPPGPEGLCESDLNSVGPLAHCVDDLELALDLLAAAPSDVTVQKSSLEPVRFASVTDLRVAVWSDDPFCPVEQSIAEHIEAAADTLERLGATVDRHARPEVDPQKNHLNYVQLMLAQLGAAMPDRVYSAAQKMVAAAEADDMHEPLLQMRGIGMTHREWLAQSEIRLRSRIAWEQFFQDFDVLLCPCACVAAFAHDHNPNQQERQLKVNGEVRPYSDIMRWAGLTLNAYLPATAVPLGSTTDGLPIGMQIAGPHFGDKTTLAVARILEASHRAFVPPPGFPA